MRPYPQTSPQIPIRTWRRRERPPRLPPPWPAWFYRFREGPPAEYPWACRRPPLCIWTDCADNPPPPSDFPSPHPLRPHRKSGCLLRISHKPWRCSFPFRKSWNWARRLCSSFSWTYTVRFPQKSGSAESRKPGKKPPETHVPLSPRKISLPNQTASE